MRILLTIFTILIIGSLILVIIAEGVVIRNTSDNHLNARYAIREIGGFLNNPCTPREAFNALVEYENLPAACGVLIQHLETCPNPDMEFIGNSINNLIDLAESKHNLKLDQPTTINVEYLEYMQDQLDEVTGMYPSR